MGGRRRTKRHNLVPLATRGDGAARRNITQGEYAKARDTGTEPDRVNLERTVRAAAHSTGSESEFLQTLRAAGVDPRPRIDKDTRRITGYSVGLPGGRRYGGGSLAQDLTLPKLRRTAWPARSTGAAHQQWQHPTLARNPITPGPVATAARALSGRDDQDGAVMDTADSVARIAKGKSTRPPTLEPKTLADPGMRPPTPRHQPTANPVRLGRR